MRRNKFGITSKFPEVFMTVQYRITRILSTLLLAGLCSAPLLRAQQTNPATPQQAPETSQQPQQPTTTQPAPTQTSPTQPATTQPGTTQTTPDQPAAAPAQNTQPAAPANQNQPQQPAPSGTTVNPSQAPLNPVTTYPDASDTQQHAAIVQCCTCCASDHDYDSGRSAAQNAD